MKTLSPADRVALATRTELHLFKAWPAMGDMDLDGWRVRIAGGYTRRANSVTPVTKGREPRDVKVPWCEKFYGERGLATVFRITDLYPDPDLDPWLNGRGYTVEGSTLIMAAELSRSGADPAVMLDNEPSPRWLDARLAVEPGALQHFEAITFIHQHAPVPTVFARIEEAGNAVAIGRATVASDLVAIDSMRTRPDVRRRGHARAILRALQSWAVGQGARAAWLQVEQGNAPGLALYENAGFSEIGGYHYRVRPAPQARV